MLNTVLIDESLVSSHFVPLSNKQIVNIVLPDKVADGFKLQGADINKDLEKVGEFHSNKLFDSIYGDITLYKWKRHQGVKK